MAYWAVVRVEPRREKIAKIFLKLAGFEFYAPKIAEKRLRRGRKITRVSALFPGYLFVSIELQWHAARWSPGVLGLIMDHDTPAHIADSVINEIRSREHRGLVVLPDPGAPFMPGERVRIHAGAFAGKLALYAGMSGPGRVAVLLASLRVTLPLSDVRAAAG